TGSLISRTLPSTRFGFSSFLHISFFNKDTIPHNPLTILDIVPRFGETFFNVQPKLFAHDSWHDKTVTNVVLRAFPLAYAVRQFCRFLHQLVELVFGG